MTSYVYLHGFASSSASSKARYFAKRLGQHGITLSIPELDGDDFEHLTITGQLAIVDRCVGVTPAVLLGSSLGGYLAALYAASHTNVERLVLLAPAFDFHKRWSARLGRQTMEQWKAAGSLPVFHYGTGQQRAVGYGLMEDAARYPAYPRVIQPTLVLQGSRDDVVPPEIAREFCHRNPEAQLRLFESGHELTDVLEELWAAAEPFLFFGRP